MTTYYVSTSGTNSPSGGTTSGTAWRTLQYAADRVNPGDIVRVLPGEYQRFDLSRGGSAAGGVVTFQADDMNDRPYIRTAYHNIPDTALGSTNRPDAAIYVTADYVTINGFRFTDERAIAIAFNLGNQDKPSYEDRDTQKITVGNCYFYRCRAIYKLTAKLGETEIVNGRKIDVDKKGTGPIWVAHKGDRGFVNKNAHFHDLEFVECSARVPVSGKGTEILTFFGAHEGLLVEDCSWVDCYGINLNFVGVALQFAQTLGQPKNILVRRCRWRNAYRTNDGAQKAVNAIYLDRGTGPAEIKECIFENQTSMATAKSSFEETGNISMILPNRRVVFHDNVIVSGYCALIMGTGDDDAINAGRSYKSEDIAAAHNVLIAAEGAKNSAAVLLNSVRGAALRNNVIANYNTSTAAGKSNIISAGGVHTAADVATWEAAGNVTWTNKAGSVVEWGIGRWQTAQTFNANVQGGSGWTSKPVFANGVTSVSAASNLSAYDLEDWTLAAASPGYKSALPLTYADGPGTAQTDITVDDPRYFAPGIPGLGAAGTTIMVGSVEAVVTSVNYNTGVLSLDREVTWADNAEIRYKPTTAGVYSVGITAAASVDDGIEFGDDDPINLLANGDFSADATSWNFDQGAGSGRFLAADGAASLPITAGSSTTQLYQYDLPITSGADYELTIYGSSDSAPQTVAAKVITHGSLYTNLGLNSTFALTASCQAHTLAFTATGSNTNARLQLIFTDPGLATIQGAYLGAAGGQINECPDSGGGSGSGTPVMQDLKVAHSLDDWGDNSGTYFGTTDAILAAGGDKDASRYDYRLLARFQIAQTITQGDSISAAALRLYRSGDDSGATIPASRIWAVASTNSTRPASSAASKAQTLTTAYTDWTMESETSEWKEIGGLAAIIQELADSGDLTAGNYITIVVGAQVSGWGGSNTMQYFRSYDYSDGSLAPELSITSIAPTGTSGDRAYAETFRETFAETWGG